jgi:hypothetical protein
MIPRAIPILDHIPRIEAYGRLIRRAASDDKLAQYARATVAQARDLLVQG